MKGQAGRILRVNLSRGSLEALPLGKYAEWWGGHGLAAALFFDLVADKTVGCFEPENVLVIAPGLFTGTLVPGAGRTELVGIQAQSYPTEWFGRSNCGGRFGTMLKLAGWDAIVLEGSSERPVWLSIADDEVSLIDATPLWGLRSSDAQKAIIARARSLPEGEMPAVLTIGPAGEHRSRIATIQHDRGCAFGQGGFGGIWGSKGLKAISVVGTGGVDVADARALFGARVWTEQRYGYDADNPRTVPWLEFVTSHFGGHPGRQWVPFERGGGRSSGCWGCHLNCKPKTASGVGHAHCRTAQFYQRWDLERHGEVTQVSGYAADLLGEYGINAFEVDSMLRYLDRLHRRGVLGEGRQIATDLHFGQIGELEFIEELLRSIAYRRGLGDDLAEGLPRAAQRWSRLETDLSTGDLAAPFWGYPEHFDPRTEPYWGYASLITSRDVNCHDFNVAAYWMSTLDISQGREPLLAAAKVAEIIAAKTEPYCDAHMVDFSDDNLYSIHMARTTAWLLHYSLFWKQSCGLCDNAFADFINPYGEDNRGLTPDGEMRFLGAVVGTSLNFAETMEIGRRLLNLDRTIWALQGRHREQEVFPDFVYDQDAQGVSHVHGQKPAAYCPVYEGGEWSYRNVVPRRLDRGGVETWKTIFYDLEGWDVETGRPTRAGLAELGLEEAAEQLLSP